MWSCILTPCPMLVISVLSLVLSLSTSYSNIRLNIKGQATGVVCFSFTYVWYGITIRLFGPLKPIVNAACFTSLCEIYGYLKNHSKLVFSSKSTLIHQIKNKQKWEFPAVFFVMERFPKVLFVTQNGHFWQILMMQWAPNHP